VSFGELQGTFNGAADVVGAGAHSEIVGDGIQTIDPLNQVSTAALNSLPATTTTYEQYDANGRVLASQETVGTQSPFNFSYAYNDQSLAAHKGASSAPIRQVTL
jgi:hypothetical protein